MWHRKTLEDLYYFRVRDSVASFCASEEGRELLETKLPFTESERYEELKDLSRNWETVLTSSSGTGLKGWEKLHSFLKILSVEGTTLEQEQLYAVYEFAFSALDIIESINRCSKTLSIKKLLALTESLNKSELSLILSEISKVLDKDGQLKDLPQLREIRASIKSLQGEIAAALKK